MVSSSLQQLPFRFKFLGSIAITDTCQVCLHVSTIKCSEEPGMIHWGIQSCSVRGAVSVRCLRQLAVVVDVTDSGCQCDSLIIYL
mmetsp:Transcript_89653/g.178248  ORF Transcript_89653/g.178248 Transcript_89653/m.178248 type:complete len:85 (-) Transcript_89653:75-329(-)